MELTLVPELLGGRHDATAAAGALAGQQRRRSGGTRGCSGRYPAAADDHRRRCRSLGRRRATEADHENSDSDQDDDTQCYHTGNDWQQRHSVDPVKTRTETSHFVICTSTRVKRV